MIKGGKLESLSGSFSIAKVYLQRQRHSFRMQKLKIAKKLLAGPDVSKMFLT